MRAPTALEKPSASIELSLANLMKLAIILSIWQPPDGVVEIGLKYPDEMQSYFEPELRLEVLTGQAQVDQKIALSYREYVFAFEANDVRFHPPPDGQNH